MKLACVFLVFLVVVGCGDSSPASGADAGVDAAQVVALDLNDVSVLVPLPTTEAPNGHLTASTVGDRGVLLPMDVYDAIPTFPVTTAESLRYNVLKVVAIRFDGCHRGTIASECEAQIRLVMQPVNTNGRARDASLHLFYSLSAGEFGEVVTRLREIKQMATVDLSGPLDVHPELLASGVDGDYGYALSDLVLTYAGEENLTRVTFFLRAPPVQETWFFGGFEREAGELEPMTIVGVGQGNQRVIRVTLEEGYEFAVDPAAIAPEDGRRFLSSEALDGASDEIRAATFASYLRVENPNHYGVDELPCAGCHLSTFVMNEAALRHGVDAADFPDDRFVSARNLELRGASSETASSLRAFGWFDTSPMISQRVVNESAAVLDDIEARFR